jgi:hypothetical protein
LGVGIGGGAATLTVGGVPVFAKRIPLTDLERRPEHVRSTANLFGVPAFCQYGVGGPGFGAWREWPRPAARPGGCGDERLLLGRVRGEPGHPVPRRGCPPRARAGRRGLTGHG